jgi:16S rRNA (cytosine967-C5)-methyltransferase
MTGTQKDRPRAEALGILVRAETGAQGGSLLEKTRAAYDGRDNAFIAELVYGTLRNRSYLDSVLDRFSAKPLLQTDAWTRNILRMAAYQMLFLDRVPVSAAVNTATELAKVFGKKNSYVNGLLRNLDRKRSSLAPSRSDNSAIGLATQYSHPAWLVNRWLSRFGPEKTEAALRANNNHAPLVIRTNTLRATREELRIALAAEGVESRDTKFSPTGIELLSNPVLRDLSSYRSGLFLVQDEAAQLVTLMLSPKPGDFVLDACAAPGGKATHLAELMRNEGIIAALENDRDRIAKIRENSERLGTSIVHPVLGDAASSASNACDCILVDAPCTGLGTLRRRPDGRWIKREADIEARAALQRRILAHCSTLLKPGGALVYATCTTEPEENENIVDDILSRFDSLSIDDPRPYLPAAAHLLVESRGFFRTFPEAPDMDGFFGARLVKRA